MSKEKIDPFISSETGKEYTRLEFHDLEKNNPAVFELLIGFDPDRSRRIYKTVTREEQKERTAALYARIAKQRNPKFAATLEKEVNEMFSDGKNIIEIEDYVERRIRNREEGSIR